MTTQNRTQEELVMKTKVNNNNNNNDKEVIMTTPKRENKMKVGRNNPCPCGSGLKHKKCCLGNNNHTNLMEYDEMLREIIIGSFPELTGIKSYKTKKDTELKTFWFFSFDKKKQKVNSTYYVIVNGEDLKLKNNQKRNVFNNPMSQFPLYINPTNHLNKSLYNFYYKFQKFNENSRSSGECLINLLKFCGFEITEEISDNINSIMNKPNQKCQCFCGKDITDENGEFVGIRS